MCKDIAEIARKQEVISVVSFNDVTLHMRFGFFDVMIKSRTD